MKLEEVKKELNETKNKMYETLGNGLDSLKATKDELIKYRSALIENGIKDESKIKFEMDNYLINKKVAYVLKDASIVERLDIAMEHLDNTIKYVKEHGKN